MSDKCSQGCPSVKLFRISVQGSGMYVFRAECRVCPGHAGPADLRGKNMIMQHHYTKMGAFPALRAGNRAIRSNSSPPAVPRGDCGISASIPCAAVEWHPCHSTAPEFRSAKLLRFVPAGLPAGHPCHPTVPEFRSAKLLRFIPAGLPAGRPRCRRSLRVPSHAGARCRPLMWKGCAS
jgi:hypothetical protein